MTNGEFVDILGVTVRLDSWPDDIRYRELRISVDRDTQGMPETITLEFMRRGFARFQVAMGNPSLDPEVRPLWVGKRMITDGHRKADACRLIEDFLQQYSLLPENLVCAA